MNFKNRIVHKNRWLVLGASGQLGREWCDRLQKEGVDFRGYSRQELDISLKGELFRKLEAFQPDVVINCAAYTHVDQAEDEKEKAGKINVYAVRELAHICAKREILLIHYSTDYVFPGLLAHREHYPDGYPESFPPDPVNVYGSTKWLGEEAIRQKEGPHLIIRVSWLCGKYGGNFVKTMLRLARERDHIRVVNDQYGGPAFTASVVTNTLAMIDERIQGTIHVTSSGETTWYAYARTIFSIKGLNVTVEAIPTSEFPTRARRPAWSRLDIKQLANVPGTRILSWEQELETLLSELP